SFDIAAPGILQPRHDDLQRIAIAQADGPDVTSFSSPGANKSLAVACQELVRDAGRTFERRHHGEIQLILEDHVGQHARVSLDDMDFGFRGLVEKLGKRRRKYRSCKSRHKADTDRSENAIGPDSLLCGVEPLQHVDALAVVYSPGGRQSNVT